MNKILVAAILLIGCISASAQNFGVGGGFVNSSTRFGNSEADAMNGFYAQGTADLNLTNAFSIVAGLRYMYTGANKDLFFFTGKTTNHTIGVPVMAKANLFNNGDLKAFIFAGPTFYYGLSSKSNVAGAVIDHYKDGPFNQFNVTVGGGVGLDAMEAVRFTIGYDYGVTNKYKANSSTKANTADIRFGVAFLF